MNALIVRFYEDQRTQFQNLRLACKKIDPIFVCRSTLICLLDLTVNFHSERKPIGPETRITLK